jgi:hypothetical protein
MERSDEAIKYLEAKIAETEEELARLQQLLTDVESDLQALRKARDLLVGEDAAPRPPRRAGALEEDAPPRPVRRGREFLPEETAPRAKEPPLEEDAPPRPVRRGREFLLEETAPRAKELPLEEDAPPRPVRRGRELPVGETAPPSRPDDVRRREPAPPTNPNRPAASSGSRQGPLRPLVLDILRDATKPLHVDELVERLRAAGKHTDAETVGLSLAEYVKLGKVWRTPQGAYALPKGFGL